MQDAPVADLGTRLELFVDTFLIDTLDGVRLALHAPRPAPPSEHPPSDGHYATVIKDGDVYRLYNRGGHSGQDGDPQETTEYFESRDGIHWKKLRDAPVFTDGMFDSQNVAFWSAHEERYVCYFRTWTGAGYSGLRTISRTASPNFIEWSEPVAMHPNLEGEHLYTSGTHPYFRAPHLYIALPTRFMPERGNATDILFMSSRGGSTFDRTFKEAFIRPGLNPDHWANRANYAALNVVPTGPEEMSIYVRGRRYVLRTDGFASVHAGFEAGEMRTRPFTFAGRALHLNVSTSAGGHVLVEIQDDRGRAIPGFSEREADAIVGDAVDRIVTWQGESDVSALRGRPVRLRVVMREADLFAVRFEE